jgi:hypothetical protein
MSLDLRLLAPHESDLRRLVEAPPITPPARLITNGKPPKPALVAVMRKIISILQLPAQPEQGGC